ncbi:MAG: DegT/DnrJ/EryC1/StrS family aminotransferase, partial [Bacteroidetes bacterium]|nr:DegT/DnrJ/EryC1/StrS family aminotransferase [Bacteroidota bacterium]
MQVPFLDLKAQYQSLREELLAAAEEVLASSAYVAGPFVKKFEEEFAQAQRIPFCAGMSTGTDALHAAIALLGIGHGDEVIVPANTFMATPAAVSLAGARPVFVDCEEKFFNIDVGQIEAAITPKTKAIIPVHLFGQPARVEAVCEIAKKHGLHVIEDCAQSHLARRNGKYTGSFGIMGCFSFYPGKNLGACGEGGAVITSDAELHKKLHAFREHGMYKKYHHDFLGHNYRMEGI